MSGSTCLHPIHFALCDIRRIPLGSNLSDSSQEFHTTTTTYSIYDYQRKETGGIQFHIDYPRTRAMMRSPDAYGVSPGRVVTYPPEPGNGRCRLFCRLEHGSGPESPGNDDREIGRKRGEASNGLRYPYVCDTSRMYCDRTNPRVHSAHPGRNDMLVKTRAS